MKGCPGSEGLKGCVFATLQIVAERDRVRGLRGMKRCVFATLQIVALIMLLALSTAQSITSITAPPAPPPSPPLHYGLEGSLSRIWGGRYEFTKVLSTFISTLGRLSQYILG